ncbi:MAG TPA: putative LPS assembly protein LptD, partial [Bacteroidales bacterium]|nr:putative LPS assembly protein LptD [Bacteroidales bacterium]
TAQSQSITDSVKARYDQSLTDSTLIDTTFVGDSAAGKMALLPDSLLPDTVISADTIAADSIKKSDDAIKSPVKYHAVDSISFDLKSRKVYLYKDSEIDYEKINLKAAHIEIDFPTDMINAYGREDSTGKLVDKPVFTEGGKEYKSNIMRYNYKTKKGYIKKVKTREGEGYLHGKTIKKMPDNSINVRHGSYTTCSLDDPHFELRYTKAKVIPKDKIVSGPAYMVIEDVPIPLILPFGFFPNKQGQQSGILVPSYGESNNRGFFFENGGYYWGISDKLDLQITGDIYTKGSWAIEPRMRYKKRYGYNGSFSGGYTVNKTGEPGTNSYQVSKDFSIRWTHSQDPKARPNSRFSSNVNIVTNSYNQFNPVSTQDYLSNTFQSSISYQTNFDNKIFITASMNHNQNTLNRTVNITLPQLSISANKFYPFRSKQRSGSLRWYENISVGYKMDARNQINTYDSLLTFDNDMMAKFENGIKHSIPVNSTIKLLKYFNLSNSINFTERWYTRTIRKDFMPNLNDSIPGEVVTDTIPGFEAAHEFSFSSSLSTRLYGMLNFKKGPVKAIRHVMSPSVSFSYRPDFSDPAYGYYDKYYNHNTGSYEEYSIFQNGIYGYPSSGESGSLNFSLSNNLEMKVRTPNDSIEEDKKIKLIENLSLNTSYNMAADSLNWSVLRVSGRTRLFDKVNLQYSSTYDPYVFDTALNRRVNKFVWSEERKLLRRTNTSWKFGLNLSFSDTDWKEMKKGDEGTEAEMEQVNQNPDQYFRWDNKWSVNLDYTFHYTNAYQQSLDKYDRNVIQTLNFNGSVNVTDKWKFRVRSGYDFKQKELSYTSLNIYRDLHCWQMSFNWIPYGGYKSWNFTIQAKSSLLQDLKLEKKKDFRDY